jgi:predicted DNA repair protein MutK
MKTCAMYGFISALSGAFLVLILFFTGFHSDPAKLTAATWIGGVCGLGIGITCMVLGVKARRAEVPASEGFSYGRALGTGFLISVFSSVLSAIFTFAYYKFINPGFVDIVVQDKMAKLEASGMSSDKLEKTEAGMRMFMGPIPQAVSAIIGGLIFGLIIALIVAAVLKRPAPDQAKA